MYSGCIKKNETGFLLNSQGKKAAKYMLTYFLLKVNFAYKKISERFQEAKILIPDFSISKFKLLILKIILMKYRHI